MSGVVSSASSLLLQARGGFKSEGTAHITCPCAHPVLFRHVSAGSPESLCFGNATVVVYGRDVRVNYSVERTLHQSKCVLQVANGQVSSCTAKSRICKGFLVMNNVKWNSKRGGIHSKCVRLQTVGPIARVPDSRMAILHSPHYPLSIMHYILRVILLWIV